MRETLATGLVDQMRKMPVIDTHEHLPPEDFLLAHTADAFTRIYCHYSMTSAITAGLDIQQKTLHDTSVPLEERWARFRPVLDAIRDTGPARSAQATVRELFGYNDITESRAMDICRAWLYENPKRIYNL